MRLTTRHARPHLTHRGRVNAHGRGNDEGSLLMALLFTIMISALTLAIMASVMAGMKKADNSRAFALAQQAADIAIADALMHANMGMLTRTPAVLTNSGKVFPSGTAWQSGSQVGTGRPIDWTWVATKASSTNDWTIDIEARGKAIDRHFRTTLVRTPVIQATWSDTNDDGVKDNIRYTAKNNRPFGSGFYSVGGFSFSPTVIGASIIDGFNGGRGMVGTTGSADLGGTEVDVINLFKWNPATDIIGQRCVDCLDYYPNSIRKFEQDFQRDPVALCTGPNQNVDWRASDAIPLKNGDCYNSLTFDVDYYFAPDTSAGAPKQAWISSRSDVTIMPGINVGANRTTTYTKASSWVIEIRGGEFMLDNGAVFSGAIYSPGNECGISGYGAQPTTWMGAAVCGSMSAYGRYRLRYDGAMSTVERPGDTTLGSGVWSLRDFQIVD